MSPKIAFVALCLGSWSALAAAPAAPDWKPWSPAAFERASSEKKFVFLYLEAVWCHWCHVMQQETLADPAVQKRLAAHYVSVRVDHDANPLLANRYRDWGWPALIVLAPDGTEIVKRAGFLDARDFGRLLDAIVADPTPERDDAPPGLVETAGPSALAAQVRERLQAAQREHHDVALGGLRTSQKFLDRLSAEYALQQTSADQQQRARQTFDAARQLLDPVWGGSYQYSTGGDWKHPHYEKIMRTQAGVLRQYSLAYARWGRETDRAAAAGVRRYLNRFLRDQSGAYYVSQDADLRPGEKAADYYALGDAARRKLGVPRIDRHLYADANGLAAEALAVYAAAAGDAGALRDAVAAADWVLRRRASGDGGFRHDDDRGAAPYLSDTLAMARGMLAIYQAGADRKWLERAARAAAYVDRTFRAPVSGYLTAVADGSPVAPPRNLEENVATARLMNLLHAYTGDASLRAAATYAMSYLTSEAATGQPLEESGILLADDELRRAPLHLTVVAAKSDAKAQALFAVATRMAGSYARVEWLDTAEGPLPNSEVSFPTFARAAGFVCNGRFCSLPSFTVTDYAARIRKARDS